MERCDPLYLADASPSQQETAAFIYCAIAIHVTATYMPIKCHIYATCANYLVYIDGKSMPILMPHMKLLKSVGWATD